MQPEIAVVNRSSLDERALAFVTRALNVQLRRDFIPAWSADKWAALGLDYRLPGGDLPWNVVGYSSTDRLAAGSYWPMRIVDDVPAGELGDHTWDAGVMSARVRRNLGDLNDGTTASHEAIEMRSDPPCDIWIPGRDCMVAAEPCDAVEGDAYPEPVTLFGDTRTISLSNFVLPAWFVPGSVGPWDFMRLCTGPLEVRPGGYIITMRDGQVKNVFADARGEARLAEKAADVTSRAARRGAGRSA